MVDESFILLLKKKVTITKIYKTIIIISFFSYIFTLFNFLLIKSTFLAFAFVSLDFILLVLIWLFYFKLKKITKMVEYYKEKAINKKFFTK